MHNRLVQQRLDSLRIARSAPHAKSHARARDAGMPGLGTAIAGFAPQWMRSVVVANMAS